MILTIDQRNARSIRATSGHSSEIIVEERGTTNLEQFLNNLGRVLIRAIISSTKENMLRSSTLVRRGTMFTDVLDAPITKLAIGEFIDLYQYLFDGWAL